MTNRRAGRDDSALVHGFESHRSICLLTIAWWGLTTPVAFTLAIAAAWTGHTALVGLTLVGWFALLILGNWVTAPRRPVPSGPVPVAVRVNPGHGPAPAVSRETPPVTITTLPEAPGRRALPAPSRAIGGAVRVNPGHAWTLLTGRRQ